MTLNTASAARPADNAPVALFTGTTVYDRGQLLAAAARARRRGRRRKAIELYRRVLAVETDNPDLERRVAPLLAETQQPDEAWAAYRRAAGALARRGFVDQAIGVYREAQRYLPDEALLWRSLADLELERGRQADALATLQKGTRQLRHPRQRPAAIRLLERAREIEPRHFETSFELAGLLVRDGARRRGARLLAELAGWTSGAELRRVRLRQLRLAPSPSALWSWIRSLVGR